MTPNDVKPGVSEKIPSFKGLRKWTREMGMGDFLIGVGAAGAGYSNLSAESNSLVPLARVKP